MHKVPKLKCGAVKWTTEPIRWYPDKFVGTNECICFKKKPENLEHFLVECDRFRTLRIQTINKYLEKGGYAPLLEKAMENEDIFKELVRYVDKALEIRNQILRWNYR